MRSEALIGFLDAQMKLMQAPSPTTREEAIEWFNQSYGLRQKVREHRFQMADEDRAKFDSILATVTDPAQREQMKMAREIIEKQRAAEHDESERRMSDCDRTLLEMYLRRLPRAKRKRTSTPAVIGTDSVTAANGRSVFGRLADWFSGATY